MDQARRRVLGFFRADPEHFDVVFVANATAAIKLVAYCFQEKGFWYGYHTDAHTSLVGLRELAQSGYHCFASDKELGEWIDSSQLQEDGTSSLPVDQNSTTRQVIDDSCIKLVGYPAQSNMNGHRTPKEWARRIREKGYANSEQIYTLLDAAAYCSSAQLDLSDPDAAPDFTSISFYKIFGMPDLGALIVRKRSGSILTSRRYFGGGTVDMVIAYDHFHAKKLDNIHEVLEDGTVPFHSLVMLNTGIVLHKRLFHSMDEISEHVSQLTRCLYMELLQLQHANGVSVCKIYKDESSTYGDRTTQGPTIAFSIRRSNGAWVHYDHFEALASACNIQIRTGGVCNPGGIARYLGLASWEMRRNYCEGFRCGEPFKIRGGKPTGIIRASLGAMSNKRDVDTLVAFVRQFFVDNHCHKYSDHTVGTQSKQHQRVWSVKSIQIFPIRHCPAWTLPASQAWELDNARFGMDGDWCLVDLETDSVLKDSNLTSGLAVRLNIELGRLFLETSKSNHASIFEVDLWELPTGSWVTDSWEQTQEGASRLARKFVSKELEDFLTLALGQPTTLARFYEYADGELPIDIPFEKFKPLAASEGILIQFSGFRPQAGVHTVLKSMTSDRSENGEFPGLLQFGSQTLLYKPWNTYEAMTMYKGTAIAKYCRIPDVEEDPVSQNTAVHFSDLVVDKTSCSVADRKAVNRKYHFCPVVDCHHTSIDYPTLLQHLKSHTRSFVPPRRRGCWFRRS